ncbi:hypothetical protein [Sphingobacterium paramultivorum]|uniref:hypothetical protein n=1 Tax=Sphingobacterium paramultivorum TaxID=2886510 RepID=UPI001892250F|nr:hypothetical protein [Sphingobacterium paramultivorum]
MTRSNLYITLSSGQQIVCVADSTSGPEQGYIVEEVFTPLLNLNNSHKEIKLLKKHCTMDEKRANANYRYYINLITKEVTMFEEHFNYTTEKFRKGKEITERYTRYLEKLNNQDNENQIDTELKALNTIAEMVLKFGQLHVLNIREEDLKQLDMVRKCLEKVIRDNGYRMNYDENSNNHLIKI